MKSFPENLSLNRSCFLGTYGVAEKHAVQVWVYHEAYELGPTPAAVARRLHRILEGTGISVFGVWDPDVDHSDITRALTQLRSVTEMERIHDLVEIRVLWDYDVYDVVCRGDVAGQLTWGEEEPGIGVTAHRARHMTRTAYGSGQTVELTLKDLQDVTAVMGTSIHENTHGGSISKMGTPYPAGIRSDKVKRIGLVPGALVLRAHWAWVAAPVPVHSCWADMSPLLKRFLHAQVLLQNGSLTGSKVLLEPAENVHDDLFHENVRAYENWLRQQGYDVLDR